jgi:hypothetical protein
VELRALDFEEPIQVSAVLSQLGGRKALRLTCLGVVVVVMLKAQPTEVVEQTVPRISIDMSDLPFFWSAVQLETEAEGAPPS